MAEQKQSFQTNSEELEKNLVDQEKTPTLPKTGWFIPIAIIFHFCLRAFLIFKREENSSFVQLLWQKGPENLELYYTWIGAILGVLNFLLPKCSDSIARLSLKLLNATFLVLISVIVWLETKPLLYDFCIDFPQDIRLYCQDLRKPFISLLLYDLVALGLYAEALKNSFKQDGLNISQKSQSSSKSEKTYFELNSELETEELRLKKH